MQYLSSPPPPRALGRGFRLFSFFAWAVLAVLVGATAPAARAQTPVWTQTFDYNSDNETTPAKIARDSDGNIFVANTSAYNSTGSNFDWTVSKYTSAGVKVWTGRFDSPDTGAAVASGADFIVAITVDTANNLYATGYSLQGAAQSYDWVTVKFSGATGARLWVKTLGGAKVDVPSAIARDSAQNVYVVGGVTVSGNANTDAVLVKYDPAGNVVYTKTFDSPDTGAEVVSGKDSATGLVVDAAGAITVIGYTEQGATNGLDGLVIRYDASGNRLWVNTYNGAGSGVDNFSAVTRDSAGNIYVAGTAFYQTANSDHDALLVKYSPAGALVWARTVDGPNFGGGIVSGYDNGDKVLVDGQNNVYMAGAVRVSSLYDDAFLVKYNPAGDVLWRQKVNYQGFSETVQALTRDSANNVYLGLTMNADEAGTNQDWGIVKINPSGAIVSQPLYDRAGKEDQLGDIVIDNTTPTRDFYVVGTGEAATGAKPFDLVIRKYTQAAVDPTLSAFDMSVGVDNKPRILWNRLNAPGVTLWTVTPTGTPDNGKAYTLPAGWEPISQTIGSDNKLRFLLKQTATGKVAIWRFSENVLTLENGVLYGPVSGYRARDLVIGPDGKIRLIWEQIATTKIALWTLPASGIGVESGIYLSPPLPGVEFGKIAIGVDGIVRVLWVDADLVYLTTLNAANTAAANSTAYTLPGFYAFDLSVGVENKPRILWGDYDGSVKIVRYSVAGSAADGTPIALGPFANLEPVSLWLGKGDNKARIMWKYTDQRMVLMRLNTAGAIEQQNTYGPY